MAKFLNYLGVIKATGLTESSKNHTPEIQMRINLVKNLDTNEFANGRQVVADLWLTEKTKDKTIDLIRSLGFDSDNLADINSDILVGCECEVSTNFEEYNGKAYEKVAFVNKVGSHAARGIKRLDDSKSQDFAKRFAAAIRNSKVTVGEKVKHVETEEETNAYAKITQQNVIESQSAPSDGEDMDDLPF